jgi:hypothetical protein
MANKRCCDQFIEKGGGCPVHSRLKMIFQLKEEFKTMKSSPTFYNWVYQNPLPNHKIIEGMLKRLKKYYIGKFNVIEVWDINQDTIIETITP